MFGFIRILILIVMTCSVLGAQPADAFGDPPPEPTPEITPEPKVCGQESMIVCPPPYWMCETPQMPQARAFLVASGPSHQVEPRIWYDGDQDLKIALRDERSPWGGNDSIWVWDNGQYFENLYVSKDERKPDIFMSEVAAVSGATNSSQIDMKVGFGSNGGVVAAMPSVDNPSVFESKIVWQRLNSNGYWDIEEFDTSTNLVTSITGSATFDDIQPSVWGKTTVFASTEPSEGADYDIVIWDGTSFTSLKHPGTNEHNPHVHDGRVVYHDDAWVYRYDIDTGDEFIVFPYPDHAACGTYSRPRVGGPGGRFVIYEAFECADGGRVLYLTDLSACKLYKVAVLSPASTYDISETGIVYSVDNGNGVVSDYDVMFVEYAD